MIRSFQSLPNSNIRIYSNFSQFIQKFENFLNFSNFFSKFFEIIRIFGILFKTSKNLFTLFEFQNGGRINDFEQRKIDTANKEEFSGRIQKTKSIYCKYNKF